MDHAALSFCLKLTCLPCELLMNYSLTYTSPNVQDEAVLLKVRHRDPILFLIIFVPKYNGMTKSSDIFMHFRMDFLNSKSVKKIK